MEYDYYKLYLAVNYCYKDMIRFNTLEEVHEAIENADGYNWYMIIGHLAIYDEDVPIASGEIEQKKTKKRKR